METKNVWRVVTAVPREPIVSGVVETGSGARVEGMVVGVQVVPFAGVG